MQQRLKFNPHGVVGVVFLVLMFGIAFFLNWNVNWWYFSLTAVLYSATVIYLTLAEEKAGQEARLLLFKWLLGCHLALLFFAAGLLSPLPWLFLGLGIYGGPAIPFLLLKTSQNKNRIHLHGLIALFLIVLMAGIAFLYSKKNFGEVYAAGYVLCALLAAVAYVVANIVLNQGFPSGKSSSQVLKLQLGCHLAFILLIVGFVLPLKDVGSIIGFFLASIAIGLAIPYLVFRGS